jgi:hypothetical protein
MFRPTRTASFFAALLLAACNVVFDLEPTRARDEVGGAGVGGTSGAGTGGAASAGQAGAGGQTAGTGGEAGTGGAGATSGAAGASGAGGAGAASGSAGTSGQASGGSGGGDVCAAPSKFRQTVKCDSYQGCKDQPKSCDQGDQSCEFDCSGQQGCENATLQCPPNGDCRVTCANYQACVGATVLCGSGVCEVVCQSDPAACKDMKDLACRDASACRVRCEANMIDPPEATDCPDDGGLCPCNDPRCLR